MGTQNVLNNLEIPDTLISAKGDLITGTADDAPSILNIGADGTILRVATDTPGWTTLTIPAAVAIHSVLAANAADTLAAVTSGAGDLTILEHSAGGVISWATPTGTGGPVYSVSPTLVTPLLGTPTSGVLTNCTGTATGLTAGNASIAAAVAVAIEVSDTSCYPLFATSSNGNLGIKGNTSLSFNSSTGKLQSTLVSAVIGFVPDANDGAYLGTTALQFSDLFLASGAVINFDNGNAAITHSAGTLTVDADVDLNTHELTGVTNLVFGDPGALTITVDSSEPGTPTTGDLWIDTT